MKVFMHLPLFSACRRPDCVSNDGKEATIAVDVSNPHQEFRYMVGIETFQIPNISYNI